MVYRVIGLMSGSSLDGLDIAFLELQEQSGKWTYHLRHQACYTYNDSWVEALRGAHLLNAYDYLLLHTAYGRLTGEYVNRFIAENNLDFQVQLIASHGHTIFHLPAKHATAQLGDGATIAAFTGINVVSDLRSLDVALGGNGAPIVPIGEKLLFPGIDGFLNIGGIANLSWNLPAGYIGFDICPANRVLNMLAAQKDRLFDNEGELAFSGKVLPDLLNTLNQLDYYNVPYPKSLGNEFGTDRVYPILDGSGSTEDLLRTYCEHITEQVLRSVRSVKPEGSAQLMVTGGGAHNTFLIELLRHKLEEAQVTLVVPPEEITDFKEAIVMALIGILRWREEYNVLSTVTGARRNSIGGAVWVGQEA